MNKIYLRKGEEKRFLSGHPWVFSNELMDVPKVVTTGDLVALYSFHRKPLAVGFYNPKSLIAFRKLANLPLIGIEESAIDKNIEIENEGSLEIIFEVNLAFFETRIRKAQKLRELLYPSIETNAYRLVYSESDELPGLIIDRFGSALSVQIFSIGMEKHIDLICEALIKIFSPKLLVIRNESVLRELEGLETYKKMIVGSESEAEKGVEIFDSDLRFVIDLWNGHKTGFFLDQRENRKRIRRLSKGKNVIDVFTSDGGFALHAAKAGASQVLALDSSETALARIKTNAKLNGFTNIMTEKADAFERLEAMVAEGKSYDLVILDPPSLAKSKKNLSAAQQAYRKLNRLGLQLTKPGGVIATASCSHHLSETLFYEMLEKAITDFNSTVRVKKHVRILETASQAPDHPIHPIMPETKYLKFAILSVEDAS